MNYRQESRDCFPIEQDGVSLQAVRKFIAEFGEKTFLTEQFLVEGGANRFFQQVAAMEKNGEIKPPFWGETSSYLRHFPNEVRSALIQNLFGELSIAYLKERFSRTELTVLDRQQTIQWFGLALGEAGFKEKKDPTNKLRIHTWQREDSQDQITIPDGLIISEWIESRCILSFIDFQMAGQESYYFGLEKRLNSFVNLAHFLTSTPGVSILDHLSRYPPPPFEEKPCYCSQPKDLRFWTVFPKKQNVEIPNSYFWKGRVFVQHLPIGKGDLQQLGNAFIKDYYNNRGI